MLIWELSYWSIKSPKWIQNSKQFFKSVVFVREMQGIMFDEEAQQQNKTKLELIVFQFLSYESISERGYYFHVFTGWPIVRATLETLEK